jgi:hypothetical protein
LYWSKEKWLVAPVRAGGIRAAREGEAAVLRALVVEEDHAGPRAAGVAERLALEDRTGRAFAVGDDKP